MNFIKINFINTGLDDQILKSMDAEFNPSDDLVKAMSKQGLVQKEIQVKGKNGQTFTRKQWVKASDNKTDSSKGEPKSSKITSYKGKTESEMRVLFEGKTASDVQKEKGRIFREMGEPMNGNPKRKEFVEATAPLNRLISETINNGTGKSNGDYKTLMDTSIVKTTAEDKKSSKPSTIDYKGNVIRVSQKTVKGETKDYYRVDGSRTWYDSLDDAKKEVDDNDHTISIASQIPNDGVAKNWKWSNNDKNFQFTTSGEEVVHGETTNARNLKNGDTVMLYNGINIAAIGTVKRTEEVILDKHSSHARKAIAITVETNDGKEYTGHSDSEYNGFEVNKLTKVEQSNESKTKKKSDKAVADEPIDEKNMKMMDKIKKETKFTSQGKILDALEEALNSSEGDNTDYTVESATVLSVEDYKGNGPKGAGTVDRIRIKAEVTGKTSKGEKFTKEVTVSTKKNNDTNNSNKPSISEIQDYGYDPATVTGDPTYISVGNAGYYKIGKNKWQYNSPQGRVLGGTYTDQQIADKLSSTNEEIKVFPSNKNSSQSNSSVPTTKDLSSMSLDELRATLKSKSKELAEVSDAMNNNSKSTGQLNSNGTKEQKEKYDRLVDEIADINVEIGKKQKSDKSSATQSVPKTKDEIQKLVASGKSKDDIMKLAKDAGITWKEHDHAGINWMRACMAMTGTSTKGSNLAQKSTTPAAKPETKQDATTTDSVKSYPKKTVIEGKTFKVENINGKPTVSISMYDKQSRLNKLEKFAKDNNFSIKYTQ